MKKFALLIGVSEYEPGLTPLPGTLKDIEALQQVLVHPDMGGFAETDIIVLRNPRRYDMELAVYNLFNGRQKDDLVLLFFSGHGIKDDQGRLFLSTRQTCKTERGELMTPTAVAASFIHEQMTQSRSRRQIVILDSCFSGAFAEGMAAKDDGKVDIKAQLGGEGRAVLASSSSLQYSFEQAGEELSIYTRYLIEGIQTGAADADADGYISINELHEYICRKLVKAAPAMTPEIHAVKEGWKIHLAKAPVGEPKLKYRKEVEHCVQNGKISVVGKHILKRRQGELGLSSKEAQEIQETVLEPFHKYQANLQEYREVLAEALTESGGQLSEFTRDELKRFQTLLRLRDEDVPAIDDLSSEQGIDYRKLRDLLKAGKWKEADEETYQVMKQDLKDDWSEETSLNFPCQDLQTIDRLWVKYSDGKFGFSVQKEIYAACGGTLDGEHPGREIWNKFCDRVGWKKAGKYLNYSDLKFNLEISPTGELPGVRLRM